MISKDTSSSNKESGDDFAIEQSSDEEAQAYLDHLLNEGAQEYVSEAEMKMPDYYNAELFEKGQSYISTYRFIIMIGWFTGISGVLAIPSILSILMCTKKSSVPSTAYRRYARTLLHILAWYTYSPSRENSKFWTSIKTVHKAHMKSSNACAKLNVGRITQKDLAITQFGFIGFTTLGAHHFHIYDDEFLEATTHLWRVLGYLLGIKDEYNICGANWAETRKRLQIVNDQVYVPAFKNSQGDKNFERMITALYVGFWPVFPVMTVGSFLFFTKRFACVEGYEYYDFDVKPGSQLKPERKRYYDDLSWWDRTIVTSGLFAMTYMHKYAMGRWFLNFSFWLTVHIMYYFPLLPFCKYGIEWSYVRIFKEDRVNSHMATD